MNYKQKSGYMLLGAGLLAVGIIIGRLIETRMKVEPRMEAESIGVFEKVTCRELEVVGEDGHTAIVMESNDKSNNMRIYDRHGNFAMLLGSIDEVGNGLSVYDRFSRLRIGLTTSDGWDNVTGSGLAVYDEWGQVAVGLGSRLRGNEVQVYNRHGKLVEEMVSDIDNWVSFKERGWEDRIKERLKEKLKQTD